MQLVDHVAEDEQIKRPYMMGIIRTICVYDLSIYQLKADENGWETDLLYIDIGLGL